jgi:hypothetical protein
MLRRIFVTKIHEETESCNKFHNEEFRDTLPKQIFADDQIKEEERSGNRVTH